MEDAISKINDLAAAHNIPDGLRFQYGTAGFRMRAEVLDPVMFRMGILASLRSKHLKGRTIGVMITASHNPEQDNGVKLVDPGGEMLESKWEDYATTIANASGSKELVQAVISLSELIQLNWSTPARVIYGRDTRPSGADLVSSLVDGLSSLNATTIDYGVITTPILHYLVKCANTRGTEAPYGDESEEGYYSKLSNAFVDIMKGQVQPSPLLVDCANGVGALAISALAMHLPGENFLQPVNTSVDQRGVLNFQCGADFVKTSQSPPQSNTPTLAPGQRACSLDGDADRLMYYYLDAAGAFRMLDGDKIAALAAGFIVDRVHQAGLSDKLQVGVVQTAYANGSSTRYLEQRMPVRCVSTGVKHLHHAAEDFSIGVYFEANGHGTVLFSEEALRIIRSARSNDPGETASLDILRGLALLINQTVGDALSDMLLVEAILAHRKWSPSDWDSLYSDLPNRLVKVSVPDRNLFTTENAERQLVTPLGLQSQIDELVKGYRGGRGFVRPSGTEDVVRVYAEADTRESADDLAFRLAGLVYDTAGSDPKGRPADFR